MTRVVIDNPIVNSPFPEPIRHFRFDDDGITDEVVEERRVSSYFVPIAQPGKKGAGQLHSATEWTKDRISSMESSGSTGSPTLSRCGRLRT